MHAPIPASAIRPYVRSIPGVCKSRGRKVSYGRFLEYRKAKGYRRGCFDIIGQIFLIDPHSTCTGFLPFMVDTGTDRTIVPRNLLPSYSFAKAYAKKRDGALDWIPIEGLTGKRTSGLEYEAFLAIPPISQPYEALGFGKVNILVVDDWLWNYGMLGLDALRNVIMVCDEDNVCLWAKA